MVRNLLWLAGVVLVFAGICALLRRWRVLGVALIVAGMLVGPGIIIAFT